MAGPTDPDKSDPKTAARAARLKAALKANMARRKAQARDRLCSEKQQTAPDKSAATDD